jgi:hypothetical protein
MHARRVFVLLE